jgi:hypothetical protein
MLRASVTPLKVGGPVALFEIATPAPLRAKLPAIVVSVTVTVTGDVEPAM